MDRLLTDEEIKIAKVEAERLSWTYRVHPSCEKEKFLLEAQDAKTASIKDTLILQIINDDTIKFAKYLQASKAELQSKDTECQARVEQIFKEIEGKMYNRSPRMIMPEDWQALKKQESIKEVEE